MTPLRSIAARTSLAVAATAAVLTGCSAAPAAAPAAPAKDQAAACMAQVSLDSTIPPGIDPDAPAPSAQEMQAWAASVEPFLAIVKQNAPAELSGSVAEYATQLEQAKQGKRLDVTAPESAAASSALDKWVHDSCGYQTLDVVNNGGTTGPVPATLKPGPVVVRFTNSGDPAKAGFVLLVGRVKEGQKATPADVDSGKTDIEQVADVVTGVLPTGPDPAYGVAVLKPGSYLVTMVLGTPPAFAGSVTSGFTVAG